MIEAEALILRWDEADIRGKSVTLPEEYVAVFREIGNMANAENVVGQAKNFRKTDEGLKCDLELQEAPFDTIVPSYLIKEQNESEVLDIEIVDLGFTMMPEDKELMNNLKVKE